MRVKQAFLDACEKRSNTTMAAESKQHRRLTELANAGELEPSLVSLLHLQISRLRTDLQRVLAGDSIPDPLPDQIVAIVSSTSAAVLALKAAELKDDADRYVARSLLAKQRTGLDALVTCRKIVWDKFGDHPARHEIIQLLTDAGKVFAREVRIDACSPIDTETEELKRTITTLKARVAELEAAAKPNTEHSGVTPTEETVPADVVAKDDGKQARVSDFVRARVIGAPKRWVKGIAVDVLEETEHCKSVVTVRTEDGDESCVDALVLMRCRCQAATSRDPTAHRESCGVSKRIAEVVAPVIDSHHDRCGTFDLRRLDVEYLAAIAAVAGVEVSRCESVDHYQHVLRRDYSIDGLHRICADYLREHGWGWNSEGLIWVKGGERLALHQAVLTEYNRRDKAAKDVFDMTATEFEEHKRRLGLE